MTTEKRPLKVFLCHAHADRDPVRGLYTRLTKDGVDAWLDKEKLLPGQNWRSEIRKAVQEADVVIVCHSKEFNQQGFRQREVRWALDTAMEKPEGEIFIIPARFEICDVLESLGDWQWVDLFEEDGYEILRRALRARAQKIGVTFQVIESQTSKTPSPISWFISWLSRIRTTKPKNNIVPAITQEDNISNIDQVVKSSLRIDSEIDEIHKHESLIPLVVEREVPTEVISEQLDLTDSSLSSAHVQEKSSPISREDNLLVQHSRPKQSSVIAEFISKASKGKRNVTEDDIRDDFGDKAYILLWLRGELIGIVGWRVENLVSCTTDIYLEGNIDIPKALSALINDVENSSKLLQCEISLIFPTDELSEQTNLWNSLNYQVATPETLGVQAWQEAANELMTNQNVLYFKQLRSERVLRPV